jgi:glycosyltransferase involved in cell wall biosynthesis
MYAQSNLHVVTPSRWLSELAKESILNQAAYIHCIPYGLDLSVYKPIDRSMARQAIDVSQDANIILFVSENIAKPRKGIDYLFQALRKLENVKNVHLLTLGEDSPVPTELRRFQRRHLGTLSDDRLIALAYNAADVFVFPTLADNLPLVLLEALACGTPVVSFDVGGVPEIVRHMETGYLADYKDPQDLARGIQTVLDDRELRDQMKAICRQVAEGEYDQALQAKRYLDLYQNAIEVFTHGTQ